MVPRVPLLARQGSIVDKPSRPGVNNLRPLRPFRIAAALSRRATGDPIRVLEEIMKSGTYTTNFERRRHFLGGSDARIIMSGDEAALIRLWKEKRGEPEPEESVQQPHRPTRRRRRSDLWCPRSDLMGRIQSEKSAAPAAQRFIHASVYRPRVGLRRRTPTTPPFSARNSTPPDSRHRFIITSSVVRRMDGCWPRAGALSQRQRRPFL